MDGVVLRYSREQVAARVTELGEEIVRAYADVEPVLVAVVPGAVPFLADLVRAIPRRVVVDFLAVRSLDPSRPEPRGHVGLSKDLEVDVSGRHVLLVDDLVASGRTLASLLGVITARDPRSVHVCVCFDRATEGRPSLPLAHVGFHVGQERLVGYGLDLDGWFRHRPDVWEVRDERRVRADPARVLARMSLIERPQGQT